MEATVLIYGLEGQELKKIKKLAAAKSLRAKAILPADHGQRLGAFCGVESYLTDPPVVEGVGPMLVFAHLAPRQLEAFLAELRTARLGLSAIKAILTPTNARWNAADVYRELSREHQEMSRQGEETV